MTHKLPLTLTSLVFALASVAQQKMYVCMPDSFRYVSVTDVKDVHFDDGRVTTSATSQTTVPMVNVCINEVDSIVFDEPSLVSWFDVVPKNIVKTSNATGFTGRLPMMQDHTTVMPQLLLYVDNGNGLYSMRHVPLSNQFIVDFAALETADEQVDRVWVKAMDGKQMAGQFQMNRVVTSNSWNTKEENFCGSRTLQNGGATATATNDQSDVVMMTVPSDSIRCTLQTLPVALTKGVAVTVRTTKGRLLTRYVSDITTTVNVSSTFNITLSPEDLRPDRWMATLPVATYWGMLSMPGAHDAATKSVSNTYATLARTQSKSIDELLEAGVRAFDLRPAYRNSTEITEENLYIYHGSVTTNVLWRDAMNTLIKFVTDNPTEHVFVNMQKEDNGSGTDQSASWRKTVRTYLQNNKARLVQTPTNAMTMSACAGKVLVVSHNPYGSEGVYNDIVLGGLADWQDNAAFQTQVKKANNSVVATLNVEDQYNLSNNPKVEACTTNISAAAKNSDPKVWYCTFTNLAWSIMGGSISSHANVVNEKINEVIGGIEGRTGVVFMDYCGDNSYGHGLLRTIIDNNHRNVYR